MCGYVGGCVCVCVCVGESVCGCVGVWLGWFVGVWKFGCMGVWVSVCVWMWVCVCVCSWVCVCVGEWVGGGVGVWVCECAGVCGAVPILGETRIGNLWTLFAIAFLVTRHRDMMLKCVTSATLTIFTLCVCKLHKTEILNASRGLLYLPYS